MVVSNENRENCVPPSARQWVPITISLLLFGFVRLSGWFCVCVCVYVCWWWYKYTGHYYYDFKWTGEKEIIFKVYTGADFDKEKGTS